VVALGITQVSRGLGVLVVEETRKQMVPPIQAVALEVVGQVVEIQAARASLSFE